MPRKNPPEPHACEVCDDWVHPKRWALGYRTCRACGEAAARTERSRWTIAPAGHKQSDTLITDPRYLRGINPKNQPGDD